MSVVCSIQGDKQPDLAKVYESLRFIQMGADAMIGIGNMMQPEMEAANEQISQAKRHEMSALFLFFGEALREPAKIVYDGVDRLEMGVRSAKS